MIGGKWRVEPNTELRGVILDHAVMAGGFVIGHFSSERIAASVVAQHNASGEPVAWQWQSSSGRWYTLNPSDPREDEDFKNNPSRYRPLYTTPSPASVDAAAVVEGLRAKWDKRDRGGDDFRVWAADEILASLKSTDARP